MDLLETELSNQDTLETHNASIHYLGRLGSSAAVRVLIIRSGGCRIARPGGAVAQPVELAGGVRVGVDGEVAAQLDGQAQQPVSAGRGVRAGS